ncbi:MAG: Rpn family recombination-promoting nuclease/putative transposase [Gemmatimonadetes bacterium]|nr:Rpn family recombination-promoting nuclease/putative transposase [Gemmatimonadota bacterium]MYB59682.1 Rpn family recombination-promoting nuclease/putative transposase [Gemmatimonadota bacterium]
MAEFDTISKHLIQKYPSDFAGFSLGREDVEVLAVIDTEQYTVEARQTDSLIRVRIDDEEVLVHNEFQTTDSTNPPMPRRMAGYIGHAIRQHGLPIYSNVIYLRPNAGQHDPGHYVQEHLGYEITIRYRVIRLIEIEGQRVLDAGHSGLIPFTPLMKPPEGMASDTWLHQCIHTARTRPIARSYRADYLAGMVVLSELVYASETISNIIFQEGIMDILRESSLFQSLTQQSREEAREEGLEQGLEQGIKRGERDRAIADILDVLEIRFDLPTSHSLSARIAAIDDLQRLKQVLRSAVQVSSLEAFEHMLDNAVP